MSKRKIIPITRPTLEPFNSYAPLFKKTLENGMLTMNVHGQELEKRCAQYLGVKYCVTTSSCTAGLMLVFQYFGLKGEVILPSFTFLASGIPLIWNKLTPVFVDIDPATYCIDPTAVEKAITKKTVAIFATHVFGIPCNVTALKKLAHKHKLKLIFDAAHAFGSTQSKKKVGGFGDVEVFSCSPTKVFTTGEGGIVATNNKDLAEFVRHGRNYGDPGTNTIDTAGLSARMPELSAAVGLRSLAKLDTNLRKRRTIAVSLIKGMQTIEPGLRFQYVPKGSQTTVKDLSVYIDPKLGFTRNDLYNYFAAHNIMTRKYFSPPLHQMKLYKPYTNASLPVTDDVSSRVLSLPMYAHLSKEDIRWIITVFRKFIYDRKKS